MTPSTTIQSGTLSVLALPLLLALLLMPRASAQTLRAGGALAPGQVLTADGTNDGVEAGPGPSVRFDPTADDRWAAFRDLPTGDGETVSGFVYDGYLYTPARADSDRRRRRFPNDVTAQVRSNAVHLAFAREKGVEREVALFVASPRGGRVVIALPGGVLGEARRLALTMAPGEGRFLLLNATSPATRARFVPPTGVRAVEDLVDWQFALARSIPEGARPQTDADLPPAFEPVNAPHTWNADDVFDPRGLADGFDVGAQYHRGVGWYRTEIEGSAFSGRTVLRLEGVGSRATVWLGGVEIGETTRTYTRSEFDLSDVLEDGPNTLTLRVDNRFRPDVVPHAADYVFFGGLYRGAQLVRTAPTYVARVDITTPEVSTARASVRVTTETASIESGTALPLTIVTRVLDPEGGVVASAATPLRQATGAVVQDLEVPLPRLWGPNHPTLYAVHSSLVAATPGVYASGLERPVEVLSEDGVRRVVDHVASPLGFRVFDWTPDDGFALNGARLQLRGVNVHQDGGPAKAWAAGPDVTRRDLELAKAMGANFVRLAHYPHHPATLAHADSLGLIVWAEIPFITSDPTAPGFAEATKRMLADMIRRDGNHPSVVLWGLGNESLISWQTPEVQQAALRLAYDLDDLAKSLDPYRLTVQAQNHVVDVTLDTPRPPAPPPPGAAPPRPRYEVPDGIQATADIQARNQYAGWYEDAPEDIGPRLDRYRAETPGARLFLSEYGAGAQRGLWVDAGQPFDFSETWQLRYHEAYLDALAERPFVAGGAVWHLFDFASHVKTGTLPHVNQKGLLTRDRRPKAAYYLYQSRWSETPMAWLLANTRTHRDAGTRRLEAFTNAPRATLYVDGEPAGEAVRRGLSTRLGWDVTLAEGTHHLRVVATWPDGRTATDAAPVLVVPPGTLEAAPDGPVRLDGDN